MSREAQADVSATPASRQPEPAGDEPSGPARPMSASRPELWAKVADVNARSRGEA